MRSALVLGSTAVVLLIFVVVIVVKNHGCQEELKQLKRELSLLARRKEMQSRKQVRTEKKLKDANANKELLKEQLLSQVRLFEAQKRKHAGLMKQMIKIENEGMRRGARLLNELESRSTTAKRAAEIREELDKVAHEMFVNRGTALHADSKMNAAQSQINRVMKEAGVVGGAPDHSLEKEMEAVETELQDSDQMKQHQQIQRQPQQDEQLEQYRQKIEVAKNSVEDDQLKQHLQVKQQSQQDDQLKQG